MTTNPNTNTNTNTNPIPIPIRSRRLALILTAVLCCAWAGAASAQEADPWNTGKGWFLGVDFISDHIGADDPGAGETEDDVFVEERGGGALLNVGYAFTPAFALRFVAGGARHETTRSGAEVDHISATLEAVFRFLHGERAQPYVFGGLGGATLEFTTNDLDSKVSGSVAVLGVGVQYHLTQHFSLDFGGRLDLINWTENEVTATLPNGAKVSLGGPVDDSGSAGKILLGLGLRF